MGLKRSRVVHPAPTWNSQTHLDRAFGLSSQWNLPIHASALPDANSASMMDTSDSLALGKNMTDSGNFKLAYENFGFSVSLYYADASVPVARVLSTYGYDGSSVGGAFPVAPLGIRIPRGTHVPTGSDGHVAILDYVSGAVWSFWRLVDNGNGTWNAGHVRKDSLAGNGYTASGAQNGPRAYGGSAMGGLIRYIELKAGLIQHALGFSYATPQNHHYAQGVGADGYTVSIASSCDADGANADTAYNVPEGARIRLRASVDIAARAAGATHVATATTIGNALQTYGAYLIDRGGHPTLYAEDLTGRTVSWTGLLEANDSTVFLPADFEVMSLPSSLGVR